MTPTLLAELKQAVIVNTLRQCSLFQGISSHDLGAIASITVPKSVSRGEYLFLENAPIDGFYVVQSVRSNSTGSISKATNRSFTYSAPLSLSAKK
jgi:hypothetical protein